MKKSDLKVIANVRVGRADVAPDASSHVPGVFEGNRAHPTQRHKGILDVSPTRAEGTPRRSTGIRPKHHDVIDPAMPKLSPA